MFVSKSVCSGVRVNVGTLRLEPEVLDPLQLELEADTVLGTMLGFSGRALCSLKH